MKRTADGWGVYNEHGLKFSKLAEKAIEEIMCEAEKDGISFRDVAQVISDAADMKAVFRSALKRME